MLFIIYSLNMIDLELKSFYNNTAYNTLTIICVLIQQFISDECGQWDGRGAYPWLALMYADNDTLLGMGTIIARRWLVMKDLGEQ